MTSKLRALIGGAIATLALAGGMLAISTPAAAASLTEVTNFGTNPSGLRMYLYVPNTVQAHPAVLVAVHYCTGSGPAFYSGTEFASLADRYGFIVIYPSATRSGSCFDVSSPQALTHDGGSDPVGIRSMVSYVMSHNNGDASRVFVTGASSGGMMTNVLLGDYPDVFKAGAAFMGVPFGCFATTDGSMWNSTCSSGNSIKTPQQWGDLVRAAYPGYSGPRPRMQVWHGTTDTTLAYPNFGEEIKQWTNVLGVSQTPVSTDTPQSGWTRTRYGATGTMPPVEAISIANVGHNLPLAGQAAMAIAFFGLDQAQPTSSPTASPSPSRSASPSPSASPSTSPSASPSTSPTGTPGACKVTYTANTWTESAGVGGFTANITITNTGTAAINGWTLKFTLPSNETLTQPGWSATYTVSGQAVTAVNLNYNGSIAAGGSVGIGFNGRWTGSYTSPTTFTLNGATCTVG